MDDEAPANERSELGDLDDGLRGRLRATLGGGEVSRAELLQLAEALSRQGQEVAQAIEELRRREQDAARVQDEVERTLREAGQALDERDSRLAALAAELEEERTRLVERSSRIDEAEQELARQVEEVESAVGDLERVRGRAVDVEAVVAAGEENLSQGRAGLAEGLRLLDERTHRVEAMERTLQEVERGFAAAEGRLDEIETRAREAVAAVRDVGGVEERLGAIERAVGALRERLRRLDGRAAQEQPPSAPAPVPDDRLARAAELALALLRTLGVPVHGDAPAEQPAPAADGHVLFVQTTAGYRLVEREGAPPAQGERLALEELGGLEAEAIAGRASPLPGDRRPCLACVAS